MRHFVFLKFKHRHCQFKNRVTQRNIVILNSLFLTHIPMEQNFLPSLRYLSLLPSSSLNTGLPCIMQFPFELCNWPKVRKTGLGEGHHVTFDGPASATTFFAAIFVCSFLLLNNLLMTLQMHVHMHTFFACEEIPPVYLNWSHKMHSLHDNYHRMWLPANYYSWFASIVYRL